jgi:hypothetical protein
LRALRRIRSGGPAGNERLSSTIGLVLIGLLGAEAATAIDLHDLLPTHLFLGLFLLGPVAMKLATTGWRFARYYLRSEAYRLLGPPQILLRMLAPLLVASALVLFGTGVAFLVVGHGGGMLLTLHAVSFVVFGVVVSLHTLAYLTRVLRDGSADWRTWRPTLAGASARRVAALSALAAGAVVALATLSVQGTWLSARHHRHHREREAATAAPHG